MKISNRLEKIASFIEKEEIVADIGCDHAQLCCHLVLEGKCKKAYACDINEGPLQQAKKNIQYYNLENSIETVLCDGLDKLNADVQTIVIAGMGYETIHHILTTNIALLKNRKCVVQSNRDSAKLRSWISCNHFTIVKEAVVYEDGHYYEIIAFDCNVGKELTAHEIMFGVKMKKCDTYYSMWKARMGKYEKILRGLPKESSRYLEVFTLMTMIYQEFGSV